MYGDMQKLYSSRFQEKDIKSKGIIWREICMYLEHFAGRKERKCVVDVASGYCEFINHFKQGDKKYAVDINPDVKKYARRRVEAVVGSIDNLAEFFKEGSVSLFFMSNFLEHISKEDIKRLLETEHMLLEPNGEVWILTPNIRYAKGKYWDFYDHMTPLTEKALMEAAILAGFKIEKCIKRFLPFTTKSRFPQKWWIVRLYLKLMPISGMIFGEQSFLILSKRK